MQYASAQWLFAIPCEMRLTANNQGNNQASRGSVKDRGITSTRSARSLCRESLDGAFSVLRAFCEKGGGKRNRPSSLRASRRRGRGESALAERGRAPERKKKEKGRVLGQDRELGAKRIHVGPSSPEPPPLAVEPL